MVTYWKSVLRTVRSSRSRFLAIFAIVALAVMFLSGLLVSTPYMQYSAGKFNNASALMDIRIVGTLGLTQEDADAVAKIDGVGAVMPAYTVDTEFILPNGENITTRVHSVKGSFWGTEDPNFLNRPTLEQGRWPENATECVIEGWNDGEAEEILGKELQVVNPNGDNGLGATTLTVVGTVRSAYYLSKGSFGNTNVGTGALAAIIYADESCFDLEVYTDMYLSVVGADQCPAYSDEYDAWVDKVQSRVEHLGKTQCLLRRDQILDEAMAQLNEAKAKLEEEETSGRKKLDEAKLALAKAEWELELAYSQLNVGQAELTAGKAELAAAKAKYEAEIAAAQAEIAKNEKLLEDAAVQLADGQTKLDAGKLEWDAGAAQLADAKTQLATLEDTLSQMQTIVLLIEGYQYTVESGYASELSHRIVVESCNTLTGEMESQIGDLRGNPNPSATERFLLDTYDLCCALAAISPSDPELNSKLQGLTDEMQQVRDGYTAAQAELADGQAQLAQAEQELADAKTQLEEAETELAQGRQDYINGMIALAQGKKDLADGMVTAQSEFAAAEQELRAGEAELNSGWAEYYQGQKEIDAGKAELEEQEATFRREIARGLREIEDAEAEVHAMEDPDWYVLDRNAIASYVSYDSDSGKVDAIAQVFPVFFFLVAALVSSTTMTRMVEEERGQIGLLKALGYSNGAIAAKFLSYAAAASALGSIAGLPIGLTLFPTLIYRAYGSAYHLPQMQYTDSTLISLLSAGLIFLAILAATAFALITALREQSAVLMRPKAPPAGKRILLERVTFLWRRLPFTWKVTARNLFRYKKRLFMTLLGVAGCTALLVAALGLRNSIGDVTRNQFNDIQLYQLSLTLRKAGDDINNEELAELLQNHRYVEQYAAVHSETAVLLGGDEDLDVYIVAPAEMSVIDDFIDFHHRTDGKKVTLEEDSVILSEKAASLLGVGHGDTITLRDGDQQEVQLQVGDVMENYLFNYVYISPTLFQEVFGRDCDFSTLYVRTNSNTLSNSHQEEAFAAKLIDTGSVTGAVFNSSLTSTFDAVLDSIGYIVILIAVCAGALALVVLYNLTNINITERQKELATLKVLGFLRGELSAYIFREGVILTLLGSIAGLMLGKLFLYFIIIVVEMNNFMFGREIATASYLISFTVTMGFSLLVNVLMEGKLRKINMAESLKAPE